MSSSLERVRGWRFGFGERLWSETPMDAGEEHGFPMARKKPAKEHRARRLAPGIHRIQVS
jgi:hypothetical protein